MAYCNNQTIAKSEPMVGQYLTNEKLSVGKNLSQCYLVHFNGNKLRTPQSEDNDQFISYCMTT
jgi:hypothetical protein